VNNCDQEIAFLRKRVSDLEKQLDNLRLSRRVLMDLLEQVEKEKNVLSCQLEKARKLKRQGKRNQNKRYATSFELYEFSNYIKE